MRVPHCLHPPVGFVAQPINHSSLGFEAQTKKPSWWFCGPNHQTTAASFEAQIGKTVNLSLEAEPRNSRSPSSCARCRPHTVSPNISIIQSPSIWPVLGHPRSSAPSLLILAQSSLLLTMSNLSPTNHETSKCVSPHDTNNRVEPLKSPRFKFKPRQVNYSSQIKPKYWPIGFSISPLMSTLTTQRHKVWISNSRLYEAQLEDQKAKKDSRRSSRRMKTPQKSQMAQKAINQGKAKESSNSKLSETNSP
jgi:hypothetical protein